MSPYSFSFTFRGVIESPPAVKMIWQQHSRLLSWDFSAVSVEVENPKSEARNSKQSPMIQIQMTKTVGCLVSVLNIEAFVF